MEYEFYHSGIKGMKWGIRRFQNPDGSLTAAGRSRYGVKSPRDSSGGKVVSAKSKRQTTKDARRAVREERKASRIAEKNATKIQKEKDDALNRELQRYEELRRKPAKRLSEAEIEELSGRLQMEKRYKELLKATEDPKYFDAKKFAADVMQDSGKKILSGLITYGVGTAINNAANAKVINVGGKWDKPQEKNKAK